MTDTNSQKNAPQNGDTHLVSSLLTMCNASTIDLDSHTENAIKCIFGVCLKFIDKQKLVELVAPDTFVDWAFINEYQQPSGRAGNLLGDSTVWMRLLSFVSFPDNGLPDNMIRSSYPPLWCIINSLKTSRVYDASGNSMQQSAVDGATNALLNFSDACKLCISINLEGVMSRHMCEQYISSKIQRNSHAVSANLLSALADERHEAGVYLTTMQHLLDIMQVEASEISSRVTHYRTVKLSQQKAWALKYVEAGKSRPSMRDVARRVNKGIVGSEYGSTLRGTGSEFSGLRNNMMNSGGNFDTESVCSAQSSSTMNILSGGMDNTAAGSGRFDLGSGAGMGSISFERYGDIVRFPNSMSRLLRVRCYLLASQGHIFDFTRHTSKIVPQDVARSLNENSITFPDVQCLCMGIESLAMNVIPFAEINSFRQRCFVSFAVNQRKGLTFTQVLHLYVAAYQKRDLWKQVWKSIYPIMSTQIAKDVESFVATVPFAIEPFITILKTSTPFVA